MSLCNYYVKRGTEVPTKTEPEVEAQNSKIINTLILKEIRTWGKRRLGGGGGGGGGGEEDRQRETESNGQWTERKGQTGNLNLKLYFARTAV